MLDHGGKPDGIIKRKGLASICSEEVKKAVLEVITENEDAVEDYKTGKNEALNFKDVNEMLRREMSKK
jgi:aspartyl-tRNA(Asn)/glutamyl-tRNA(Gln) amidotransferase subunit B